MKKCPNCNRTYADDGFTFCLEDGALLSAPYNPAAKDPISTLQSSGPPPTAVLTDTASRSSKQTKPTPLSPTVASPTPRPATPEFKAETEGPELGFSASRTKKFPLGAAIFVSSILIVSGVAISIYLFGKSSCPKVTVHCNQMQTAALASLQSMTPQGSPQVFVYCYVVDDGTAAQAIDASAPDTRSAITSLKPVLAFQEAAGPRPVPKGIEKVRWSTSIGKVTSADDKYDSTIDITGLSGRSVTVTANLTASSWFCSGSASTTFVAK